MSLEEAALYRRRFFKTYAGLKRWHDLERRAWQRGETVRAFPRKMIFPRNLAAVQFWTSSSN